MIESGKYQNGIELLQGTPVTGSLQYAKYFEGSAFMKKHLAGSSVRWLQLVRAIGAVIEPEVEQ